MAKTNKIDSRPVDDDLLLLDTGGTGVEEEEVSPDDRITEPFDPTKIRIETKTMTIDLLLTRIAQEELNLTPGFQRKGGLWKDDAQSRLIESVLIRIPLPAFYMDATDDNKWLVVDGLQRLTTLRRFVLDDELPLEGLEFLSSLTAKRFKDLPRNFQRRIKETQVTVYLIEKGTPPDVKFNIFKRINTGGLPLSAQEIRHALNQGEVTQFLARLAGSKEFLDATDHGIRDQRMADRECVLRFLAFTRTPYQDYKRKDFDGFLNDEMAVINRVSKTERNDLERQFKRSMIAAYRTFGRDAFRKRYSLQGGRYPISKALFDTWSVNLNQLEDEELRVLEKRKDDLKKAFVKLMNSDSAFESSISQGTGDPNKVRTRFSRIEQLLQQVIS